MLAVLSLNCGFSLFSGESLAKIEKEKFEVEEFVLRELEEGEKRAENAASKKLLIRDSQEIAKFEWIAAPINFFSEHASRNGIGCALTT